MYRVLNDVGHSQNYHVEDVDEDGYGAVNAVDYISTRLYPISGTPSSCSAHKYSDEDHDEDRDDI